MDQSSLDRIFAHMGSPGWDKIYPNEICEKCYKHTECATDDNSCAAIRVIGGLAICASLPPFGEIKVAHFMENMKKVLEK